KLDAADEGSVKFLGSFNLPPYIKTRMWQMNWNICLLTPSILAQGRLGEQGLGETEPIQWTNIAFGLQSIAVDYELSGQVSTIAVFHAIPLNALAASQEWVKEHLSRWRASSKT
ncbi:hypothetical protein BS50DRAFT_506353, partial [Corynespora cassiicola Philippines]